MSDDPSHALNVVRIQSSDEQLESKIRGLIFGHAIGDAIGLLTEFMSKEQAHETYGDKKDNLTLGDKVDTLHRSGWKVGDWTDDTDQMILIIISILQQKGEVVPVDYGNKLKKWAQRGFPELGDFAGMGIGATTKRVLEHKGYNTDPHQAAYDIWDKGGQVVAPNGALMRTSVLGAYKYHSIPDVIKNSLEICKVTHADPRCQASVVAMTTAVALMIQCRPEYLKKDQSCNEAAITKEAYQEGKKFITNKKHRKEMKKHMFADSLKQLKLSEQSAIGYTFKCLGAGFWAFRQNDFRIAVQQLLMEGGDADTNCAVAGALLGCKLAYQQLPDVWIGELRYKEWLDVIVDRFLPLIIPTYNRKHLDTDNPDRGAFGGGDPWSKNLIPYVEAPSHHS